MKVLVACEFSGVVRDAFLARGHDAISCDLLPTERPGPHLQGDVLRFLDLGWDLLVAHPPCTFLSLSGVRWLYGGKGTVRDESRWSQMVDGALFFKALLDAPVPRVAVENPQMHGHARNIVGRGPSQSLQPWEFGHPEVKATWLWLRRLPPLVPTHVVTGRDARIHRAAPGPNRARDRSRTFQGIADAMADQWGGW